MISIKRYQKIIAHLALCLVFSINLLSEPEEVLLKTIDAKNILSGPHGELKLEGNVYIKTNLLEFWSDRATYNKENQSFKLAGNVKVLSKNLEISSKTLAANLSEQTFMLESSSFVFQNSVYGKAKTLKILKSGNVELLNTSFNSCSLDDPVWDISSKKITLIEKGNKAIVRGLKFKIGNVPILYIPYLQTPIGEKRLSGFLTPSLKQGKDGVDIALPYYFNLAPNYDLTLSPRYIEERGEGIGFNFRYLNPSSTGEISLNSLNGDRKYKVETGADLRRWRGSLVHTSNFNNQLFSEIKYEDVSDDLYFRDIDDNLTGSSKKNYLQRKLNIFWKNEKVNFGIIFKESQPLSPFALEGYKSSPLIYFNSLTKKKNLTFSILSRYENFKLNEVRTSPAQLEEIKRSTFHPKISYKKVLRGSEFIFAAGSQETKYEFSQHSVNNSYPWLSSEYKVFFEKNDILSMKSFVPRIKYIHVKDEGSFSHPTLDTQLQSQSFHNLYSQNWYSGLDRVFDRDRIIVGFEHFTSSKVSHYYSQLSLGRPYFLEKNPTTNLALHNQSPLVFEYKASLSKNMRVSVMSEFDSRNNKVNSGFVNFSYKPAENKSIQLRSSFRRPYDLLQTVNWADKNDPVNYTELSSEWALSKNISVFSKVARDMESNSSKDILFGFQYSNCCLKVGMMKRKWEEQDYFSWRKDFQDPYFAISKGYDPIRLRDNIYIFIEFNKLGRFGEEISEVISSTLLD
jgi:LPS-assembly protein